MWKGGRTDRAKNGKVGRIEEKSKEWWKHEFMGEETRGKTTRRN